MSDEGDLYGGEINQVVDANYALTDVVSPALNLHFARDAMGDIVALGNAAGANPATETYTYDALYRLTGLYDVNGNPEEAYTYSKTGDRLSKMASGLDTGIYSYQSGTHHLASIGNASRVYDANGNTTGSVVAGNTYGFGYNGRNRMTVAQLNGGTVGTYTYNALGQRVAKVSTFPASTSQRFVYNESSQLLSEYGSNTRDYIWLDDLPVATVDTQDSVSTISYVTSDGMNTPRAVTDGSGNALWQWSYQGNSFGEQQPTSTTGYVLNLRFMGQYYDAESGLSHNGYRDYEAARGGYDQPDPLGPAGGPNPYAYVGNKPLSRVDPLGLQEEPVENIEEEREEFDNLFGRKLGPNQVPQNIVEEQIAEGMCRAPGSKKPPIYINPANISGLKPGEIDALARSMGLIPRGPDPMNGRGSYLDPDTGQQRILSHPDADPPHAHVNDPSGQRLDINGNSVPAESPDAHLPIGR